MNKNYRDHFYLWCHEPGVYNSIEGLGGHSSATPVEAADFMGIENIIMVSYAGKPVPPFAPIQQQYTKFKHVVWSIIGDTACKYDNPEAYVDEVISLKRNYPNVSGGIMDDFFNGERSAFDLDAIAGKMCAAALPLWVVVYDFQLCRQDVLQKLEKCDVITFWTWDVKKLASMEKNLTGLHRMFPGKKIVAGCYLWNFGGDLTLTVRHMEYQCCAALDLLDAGIIGDIIILGSPLIGIKLPAIDWTRDWIRKINQ
ncbi:MAG: hypothetical protein J5858_06645 [Lentisphaeria bacterium]|nr:hypothetical protein [Lentisphaeria bacterium]